MQMGRDLSLSQAIQLDQLVGARLRQAMDPTGDVEGCLKARRNIMSEEARAKAVGGGIAGSAIAAALLDLLVAKGLLTSDERRGVLEEATYRAAMYGGTADGYQAIKIIGAMLEAEAAASGEG